MDSSVGVLGDEMVGEACLAVEEVNSDDVDSCVGVLGDELVGEACLWKPKESSAEIFWYKSKRTQ